MANDELRAAAEYMLECYKASQVGEIDTETCRRLFNTDDPEKASDIMVESVLAMARHIVASHPADNGEPITPEWSAKFLPATIQSIGHMQSFRLLDTGPGDPRWMLEMVGHAEGEPPNWPEGFGTPVENRGDLRLLLRALKVGEGV